MKARRDALEKLHPRRETRCDVVSKPDLTAYAQFAVAAGGKEMSTTVAFVRMLGTLLKDPSLGPLIVPIVADEARTFSMANLFRQVGIYSSVGQRYSPEDIDSILSYREATNGQILEEGISEAGAIASWTAAATSYSVTGSRCCRFTSTTRCLVFNAWAIRSGLPPTSGRVAFFSERRRVARRWAARDCGARDGTSHLIAATIPNCEAYDPALAGRLAVIMDPGIRKCSSSGRDVLLTFTLMNESYPQPTVPEEVHAGLAPRLLCLRSLSGHCVRLKMSH